MPSSANPASTSCPLAPPVKPSHRGVLPRAERAIATCAALPPAAARTWPTRLTLPNASFGRRTRLSMAGLALTQTIMNLPFPSLLRGNSRRIGRTTVAPPPAGHSLFECSARPLHSTTFQEHPALGERRPERRLSTWRARTERRRSQLPPP